MTRQPSQLCRARWAALRQRVAGDEGMVSAFLLATMIGLFAVAGLGLDPGEAYAAKIKAIGQAEEAARAGAQQLDLTTYRTTGTLQLDPAAAEQAAQRFLTAQHLAGTGTVTATTTRMSVTITTGYRTQLWQLAGVDTITVHATGTAVPQRGITGPENP